MCRTVFSVPRTCFILCNLVVGILWEDKARNELTLTSFLQLKQNLMKERGRWNHFGQYLRFTIKSQDTFMIYSTVERLSVEVS